MSRDRTPWGVLCLLLVSAAWMASAQPAPARPDIVIIMADDMGYSDIGCYGGEIRTPNLDKLAEAGLRFSSFYNSARCCPTRAAMLTGLYPHQAGVGHMVTVTQLPGYQGHLSDRCVTIAQALRPAGYRTLMSGKWHIGEDFAYWPRQRGFDRFYGLVSGASNYFAISPERTFAEENRRIDPSVGKPDYYLTDDFTQRAVDYLDQYGRDPQPLFLYLPYTAPHWPLHAPAEDVARYRGKYLVGWDEIRRQRMERLLALGLIDPALALSPRDASVPAWDTRTEAQKQDHDLRMAVYAAQIDRMDQNIGRVVEKLRQLGRLDNTLIFFFADNGGCDESRAGDRTGGPVGTRDSDASYGRGWANTSNTPFRLYKSFVHEGGIATPLIVHWPAKVKPNSISHAVGHVIDIMATCLEVAGATYPTTFNGKDILPLEGRSLVPVLTGGQRADAPIFWEHQGNRAVRLGNWKAVARNNAAWELYDMAADRAELRNLASANAAKLQELTALYDQWTARAFVLPYAQVQRAPSTPTTRPAIEK
jgi:arylsulfatase A-like enzyme